MLPARRQVQLQEIAFGGFRGMAARRFHFFLSQHVSMSGSTQVPPVLKGATLPAFPGAHGPKTPCRTPIFLDFGPACRDRGPTAPGGRFARRPRHGPCWVLSTISAESHLYCRIGAVVGDCLGWVEQPHRIAGHHGPAAPRFSTQAPVVLSACSGPAGQKAAQPAPKRPGCLAFARGLVVCRRAMTKIEVLSVHFCTSCGP